MALQEIKVPDIGDYSGVEVIEVNVSVGDTIAEEDALITLETDKATMEVPSPAAGKVAEIVVKTGDKVSEGDLILKVEAEGAAADDSSDKGSDKAKETDTTVAETAEKPAEPQKAEAKEQAKPAAASASGGVVDVKVPDIGDYKGVDIIEVNVAVGDKVEAEAPLITLETDKATMEVPSPQAGEIKEIVVKEGDKVSEGDVIVKMATTAAAEATGQDEGKAKETEQAVEQPKQEKAPEAPTKTEKAEPAPETSAAGSQAEYASPGVRRLARELDINLAQVSGSGRKGRITKDDLNSFIRSRMQGGGGGAGLDILPDPVIDFGKFGETTTQPLSRIKKISGANLARNWIKIPHITFFEDADITEMEAFRNAKKAQAEKLGLKLTPVPFLVKAVAKALRDFPNVNSSLTPDGQNQVMKNYVHVGVAVDTPNGLVVPVLRDCDKKGLFDITRDFLELVKKARDGQLKPTDMQGGCFTISSLGGIGTHGFTPIVNMPEVAILGVSKAQMKPVYDGNGGFKPRLMLPLSLSVDHRVVDGAEAGQFVVAVANYLADLREILL